MVSCCCDIVPFGFAVTGVPPAFVFLSFVDYNILKVLKSPTLSVNWTRLITCGCFTAPQKKHPTIRLGGVFFMTSLNSFNHLIAVQWCSLIYCSEHNQYCVQWRGSFSCKTWIVAQFTVITVEYESKNQLLKSKQKSPLMCQQTFFQSIQHQRKKLNKKLNKGISSQLIKSKHIRYHQVTVMTSVKPHGWHFLSATIEWGLVTTLTSDKTDLCGLISVSL